LCQIQYNFADENFQAGTQGLRYANKKGLAVIVMEPIKGGRLIKPPENIAKLWEESLVKKTPQELALRWVWNHPEVTLALSGMNKFEQVVENVSYAEYSELFNLNAEEFAVVERVRDAYHTKPSRFLQRLSGTACLAPPRSIFPGS